MRIHLQTAQTRHDFGLDQTTWDEAAVRAPDVSAGHVLSFGTEPDQFAGNFAEAEILIVQTAAISKLLPLPPAPNLRLIYVTSAGLDGLAPFDWVPEGVKLLNNRGTHRVKSGEYGLMTLLMFINRIPALMTAQREGRWAVHHGTAAAGHHVVIVGLGTLGGATAEHAKRLGIRVTGVRTRAEPHPACDRVVSVDALERVLPEAEMLYLAAPLTPATENLLSRERIAMLPKGAGVANVGRGKLLDQEALMDALDSGHLGGAVLDVFDPEPIPPGHRLWTTPNLIITPHTSADDPVTYNARSLDIFFENLRALRDSVPLPNEFHIDRGY